MSQYLQYPELEACCQMYLAQFDELVSPASAQPADVDIQQVLQCAIRCGPPIGCAFLLSIFTTLQPPYTTPYTLRMLSLLRVWCGRLEKLDEAFIQRLMPLLQDTATEVQMHIIEIMYACSSLFPQLSTPLLRSLTSYFLSSLHDAAQQSINAAMTTSAAAHQAIQAIHQSLHILSQFPAVAFTPADYDILLENLIYMLLHPHTSVRRDIYTFIGEYKGLHTPDYFPKLVTILYIGLSDSVVSNALYATEQFQSLLAIQAKLYPYLSFAHDPLTPYLQALHKTLSNQAHSYLETLIHFDHMARLIVSDGSQAQQGCIHLILSQLMAGTQRTQALQEEEDSNDTKARRKREYHNVFLDIVYTLFGTLHKPTHRTISPYALALFYTHAGQMIHKEVPVLLLLKGIRDQLTRMIVCHTVCSICFILPFHPPAYTIHLGYSRHVCAVCV